MTLRPCRSIAATTAGLLAMSAGFWISAQASAQQLQTGGGQSGGSSSGSGFGSSSGGSSLSSSLSGSSSTRSGTGTTGTGTGQSTGFGTGANGMAAQPGFVGGNATQEFIGATRQATQSSNSNRQFRGIQDAAGNRNSMSGQQTGTPRSVPFGLRVSFSMPTETSVTSSMSVATQASIQQVAQSWPDFQNINIQLSPQGIATLTGSADNVEIRRLAANLIRLQPGIRGVENQILVPAE